MKVSPIILGIVLIILCIFISFTRSEEFRSGFRGGSSRGWLIGRGGNRWLNLLFVILLIIYVSN